MLSSSQIAKMIIADVLLEINPEKIVKDVLSKEQFKENLHLFSIGKAAWTMANAAHEIFKNRIQSGVVITKHGHSKGKIGNFKIFEAGHPIPDINSLKAGEYALEHFSKLNIEDELCFLISGGGSSLFEVPFDGIKLNDIQMITQELLKSGKNIKVINSVRKRLSKVKGGQFAELVNPASIKAYIISDVIGDNVEDIASGPISPQTQQPELDKLFGVHMKNRSPEITNALKRKLPKHIKNSKTMIIDNVFHACQAAKTASERFGLDAYILTARLECEAKEAADFICAIIKDVYAHRSCFKTPCCLIFGGETLVHVNGNGKGGRNQELALTASIALKDLNKNCALFSLGTDGTDGPTDAAGGLITPETFSQIVENELDPYELLKQNDSYRALSIAKSLIKTGPTGTNVNDLICAICL